MGKLQGLRFIPMILRAYHQAQLQMDANTMSQVAALPEPTTVELQKNGIPRKRPEPIKSSPKQSPQRIALGRQQNTSKNQQQPQYLNMDRSTSLIRALRVTNQKLKRLDTIQRQLKEMDDKFEGLRAFIHQTDHRRTDD